MPTVIGQFNDSFAPIADGVCNVVRNYAHWLNQKEYGRCCVITPCFPGYNDDEDFEVLRYRSVPVPLRRPYRAGIALFDPRFQKKIKGISFDIIHVHSPFSCGRLGLHIARKLGIPVIATFHSKYYDDFVSALKSPAAARLMLKNVMSFYSKADRVWTVSRSAVDTMREYGFRGDVQVVGNGTDICAVCAPRPSKSDILRLLYVGQLVWHKNLKLLVFALRLLKDSGTRFSITVVGEGNAQQGLKRLVQRLGLGGEFMFLGRIDDRDKLSQIYSGADINLLPSVYDTFSIVVREAAALGCPSIVIKGSCAGEDITDGFNGFLCGDDIKEFAHAIQRAASDRSSLAAAGCNARNTLFRSWESVVCEVAQRYSDVINEHKRHRLIH